MTIQPRFFPQSFSNSEEFAIGKFNYFLLGKKIERLNIKEILEVALHLNQTAKKEYKKYIKNTIISFPTIITLFVSFVFSVNAIARSFDFGVSLPLSVTGGVAIFASAVAFKLQDHLDVHKNNYDALIKVIKKFLKLDFSSSAFSMVEKSAIKEFLSLFADQKFFEICSGESYNVFTKLAASAIIHLNLFEMVQFVLNDPQNLENLKKIFNSNSYQYGFKFLHSVYNLIQDPKKIFADLCGGIKRVMKNESFVERLSEKEIEKIKEILDILASFTFFLYFAKIKKIFDVELKPLIDDLCQGDFNFKHLEMIQFILNDEQNLKNLRKIFNSKIYKYVFKFFMKPSYLLQF
jgi:hypothetical protein